MKRRINSLGMWASATVLILFPAVIFALTNSPPTNGVVKKFETVEELLDDNVAQYRGRNIQVSGEVEEINGRTFILESGGTFRIFFRESSGIFNDEIVVVVPEKKILVMEGSDITVTGVIRTVGLAEIEREYDLDLAPEIEAELNEVEIFLIAKDIAPAFEIF